MSGAAALATAPAMKTAAAARMTTPAAEAVAELAREGGAGDGADRDRGDDHSLLEAVEAEVRADEQQRAGDDAGVVAEQQTTEPRDDRRPDDVAVSGALGLSPGFHLPGGPYPRRWTGVLDEDPNYLLDFASTAVPRSNGATGKAPSPQTGGLAADRGQQGTDQPLRARRMRDRSRRAGAAGDRSCGDRGPAPAPTMTFQAAPGRDQQPHGHQPERGRIQASRDAVPERFRSPTSKPARSVMRPEPSEVSMRAGRPDLDHHQPRRRWRLGQLEHYCGQHPRQRRRRSRHGDDGRRQRPARGRHRV